jgi:hypothetical protein
MLKENTYKKMVNQCPFTAEPLVEVYKRLCNLEAPYLWVKIRHEDEELYYISDIKASEGVLSGWTNSGGWEMPECCEDIINLQLLRIKQDKEYAIEQQIALSRTNRKTVITADELMKRSGIRIPTEQELALEEFDDGLPGHITTNEEKVVKLQKEVEECEKEIMTRIIQNEAYADIVGELSLKVYSNENKIEYRKKRIKKLLSEINNLTSNV